MTTRINATLTKGRFTLRRVALRRVDLYCGDTLLERAISPIVAFAYGFGDSAEFQQVFLESNAMPSYAPTQTGLVHLLAVLTAKQERKQAATVKTLGTK